MKRNIYISSTLFLTFLSLPAARAASPDPSAVNREHISEAYGHLPMSFEANQGQTDPQVKFLARGRGYSFFLTENEAVLALKKSGENMALRMKPVGANPRAAVSGIDELPGRSNYFIGNDPKQWRTNIPAYGAVKYARVYPGIDLVYHGDQRQLEYDFLVAPGADLSVIELSFQGASKLSLNHAGDLVIKLGRGEVIEHAPVVYQEIGGQHQAVAGRYVLRGRTRVGFSLAAYDRRRSLVIDPTLAYSTYLGGTGGDAGLGIAVDASGNAYITGQTNSSDFPTTPGGFQTDLRGKPSAFVSKLNPDGSALVYSTYLGGSQGSTSAFVGSIAVDASGNAYITAGTASPDFPTTPGAFQTLLRGSFDAFVTKLDATGSALVYSTYLGGSNIAYGIGIALDAADNAYVTGATNSPDFPTTPGAFQITFKAGCVGCDHAFISKLNAVGSALVYSTFLGGSGSDVGKSIAVDASGTAYVAGGTTSSNFPTTSGAFQTTFGGGGSDAFVTKLNAAGSALVYSTYLGGSGREPYNGTVAVDASGNAYVTGSTESTNFPTTPGAFQTTLHGSFACGAVPCPDAFVTKLNAAGSALVYSTYLGGESEDDGFGIALDASGNAYVAGLTFSSDFPTTPDAFQTSNPGSAAAFISKLNAAGSALLYSTYLGGGDAAGIAVDASGNAYVTGDTNSSNFPTTSGAFQTTFGGADDAFVSKFSFGVPFSCFKGKLELDLDEGAFELNARFNLGSGGSIDPSTEPVSLTVGTYSVTIPAGSFMKEDGGYHFQGRINGVSLDVQIKHRHCGSKDDNVEIANNDGSKKCPCTTESYRFLAEARGANLKGTSNPVSVSITIGNNSGTTQINADFQ